MSTTLSPPKHSVLASEAIKKWFRSEASSEGIPPLMIREWLAAVIEAHYRIFYSIAFGYVHDHASAEDLVQNAVMKALQSVKKLREPEAIVGWLAAITRNACLEELRRHKGRNEQPVETLIGLQANSHTDIDLFEAQALILTAINSLPENQAIVIRLRFLEDCDLDEIAERLGLRKNTVEVRIHRALAALAKNPALRALRGSTQ